MDAGYDRAIEVAKERGVRVPGVTGVTDTLKSRSTRLVCALDPKCCCNEIDHRATKKISMS